MAVSADRAGGAAATAVAALEEIGRRRRRRRRRPRRRGRVRVQRRVVRVQPVRDGGVRGGRRVRGAERRARGQGGPVAAHAEQVVGRGDGAAGDAAVHGVRVRGVLFRGPAPRAVRDRPPAAGRGRHAGRDRGGPAAARRRRFLVAAAGGPARGPVRGRLSLVVHDQPDQLDVLRVLRVSVHRAGRHAHVRSDRVEYRPPVRAHQHGHRAEAAAGARGHARPRGPRRHDPGVFLRVSAAAPEVPGGAVVFCFRRGGRRRCHT